MPFYEYRCRDCERITEKFISKPDGGPARVLCIWCSAYADKVLSTVNHKGKDKGRFPRDGAVQNPHGHSVEGLTPEEKKALDIVY